MWLKFSPDCWAKKRREAQVAPPSECYDSYVKFGKIQ